MWDFPWPLWLKWHKYDNFTKQKGHQANHPTSLIWNMLKLQWRCTSSSLRSPVSGDTPSHTSAVPDSTPPLGQNSTPLPFPNSTLPSSWSSALLSLLELLLMWNSLRTYTQSRLEAFCCYIFVSLFGVKILNIIFVYVEVRGVCVCT